MALVQGCTQNPQGLLGLAGGEGHRGRPAALRAKPRPGQAFVHVAVLLSRTGPPRDGEGPWPARRAPGTKWTLLAEGGLWAWSQERGLSVPSCPMASSKVLTLACCGVRPGGHSGPCRRCVCRLSRRAQGLRSRLGLRQIRGCELLSPSCSSPWALSSRGWDVPGPLFWDRGFWKVTMHGPANLRVP